MPYLQLKGWAGGPGRVLPVVKYTDDLTSPTVFFPFLSWNCPWARWCTVVLSVLDCPSASPSPPSLEGSILFSSLSFSLFPWPQTRADLSGYSLWQKEHLRILLSTPISDSGLILAKASCIIFSPTPFRALFSHHPGFFLSLLSSCNRLTPSVSI